MFKVTFRICATCLLTFFEESSHTVTTIFDILLLPHLAYLEIQFSWNLESLCLQDRPQSGYIITRAASHSDGQSPTLNAQTSWISQELIIESYSNFKLKLRWPNQIFQKGRRPPKEGDLKILKVEYLSNHWSDLPQVLNLSKVEYLRKPWSDLPKILNLS